MDPEREDRMRSSILAVLTVLALAGAVLAADDILTLKNGKFAVGTITALDGKGVTLAGKDGEARYDWDALTARCQYEIRSDHLGEKDAEGHAALADFCLANRLFAEARSEANIAKGLGFEDTKALAAFIAEVNRAEAEFTFAKVDQLVAEKDYDAAREEIRRFLRQAPPSDDTERARKMVADLIRRRDAQLLAEEEEQKIAEKLAEQKKLTERIEKLTAEVKAARDAARDSYAEAVRYHNLGNITRARKAYEAAEEMLFRAHHTLSRIQRLVRRGTTFDKASEEKTAIRKKLVEVYLGLANLYCSQRNFKRGMPYILKVLFLDPVNEEALDLREDVNSKWLKTSARRLTNTPGVRVTSGANR
jgi:tetratricopeptide (TPR) repeat protein